MEESAYRLFLREFIVKLNRLGGGQHVRWHLTFLQEMQCLVRGVEHSFIPRESTTILAP
jgi:hypothetical protein